MINQGQVNESVFEYIIDVDAPGLESYDGRCINVNRQGKGEVSQLGDVQRQQQVAEALDVVPVVKHVEVHQHDRRQVNDWNMFK